MNLKQLLSGAFAMLLATGAYAQDEIHKANGDVIEAKIKNVTKKSIMYKMYNNPDGPDYIIEKNKVDKIVYENGAIIRYEGDSESATSTNPMLPAFMEERRQEVNRMLGKRNDSYGNNILALAPVQITERGIGVSLSYERVLDPGSIVSFYMPVVFTFNDDEYHFQGDRYSIQVMPGLKIYPTGSKGIVRYSIGPSLYAAYGEKMFEPFYYGPYYSPYYGSYPGRRLGDHFSMGMLVNNTLNINPTPHLYLGLELGLGVSYINRLDGINLGTEGLAQFGFKVGYRF
jgi:hypothetical protein